MIVAEEYIKEYEAFITNYFKGWGGDCTKHDMYKAKKAWEKYYLKLKQERMTVEGNIKLIGETVTFDSGFTKRQIVVTTNETYPQEIAIDFIKDGCTMLDSFEVGQNVCIAINIRGNEYNGKYYVSLQGWKIDNI